MAPSSDVGFWDLLSMVVDSATPELNPETSSPEIRAFMSAWCDHVLTARPVEAERPNAQVSARRRWGVELCTACKRIPPSGRRRWSFWCVHSSCGVACVKHAARTHMCSPGADPRTTTLHRTTRSSA